eukprot:428428-Prymnesium_polylepis.1
MRCRNGGRHGVRPSSAEPALLYCAGASGPATAGCDAASSSCFWIAPACRMSSSGGAQRSRRWRSIMSVMRLDRGKASSGSESES